MTKANTQNSVQGITEDFVVTSGCIDIQSCVGAWRGTLLKLVKPDSSGNPLISRDIELIINN